MSQSLESRLAAKPKILFFTDFDGTITLQDTNDFVTDNYGHGYDTRRGIMDEILKETETFRGGFQKMLDSWNMPFPKVLEILSENIQLDPGFKDFMVWARSNKVPVIVLSSGMYGVIDTLLKLLLGDDLASDLEIISNTTKPIPPKNSLDEANGWTIEFHDDSGFGHDKSLTLREYAKAIEKLPADQRPTMLYAGDGVSDLSAARESDLLFAKEGQDLVTYCEREGIPFTTFKDWTEIKRETEQIFSGEKSVKRLATESLQRVRTNSIENQSNPPKPRRASSFDQAAAEQELKRLRSGVSVEDAIKE
ncbi:putative phosphatase [Cyphellophora attinorum]|uniref:Putative phosphatase n=1 Tax=Cyphellophora attinorum TaxID=1664694 RepID=A0A0N1NYD3_9EURO|nr:putative phosphatase [Phialophora attinorum]KPI35512.1 putative phosphatase [Phialophora attinorum]